MNIHHLELFYYVAKYSGVSAAARKMPYGIQQPAISAQLIQLEDSLGTTLFHRRPFQLTKPGEELFQFIKPFFDGLTPISQRLRGGEEVRLRIGAPETVQREYLPGVLRRMRKRFPEMAFSLIAARVEEIEEKLLAQELDLGIGALLGKRPEGIRQKVLVQVPIVLLVPKESEVKNADALWKRDRIDEPLISLPADDPTCRLFQQELRKRKIDWFTSIELATQELVACYAAEGFGIGLVLLPPGRPAPEGTRALPLKGFPSVPYGAVWFGALSPVQKAFLEEIEAAAANLRAPSDRAC